MFSMVGAANRCIGREVGGSCCCCGRLVRPSSLRCITCIKFELLRSAPTAETRRTARNSRTLRQDSSQINNYAKMATINDAKHKNHAKRQKYLDDGVTTEENIEGNSKADVLAGKGVLLHDADSEALYDDLIR